jgi:hypothetical protein
MADAETTTPVDPVSITARSWRSPSESKVRGLVRLAACQRGVKIAQEHF